MKETLFRNGVALVPCFHDASYLHEHRDEVSLLFCVSVEFDLSGDVAVKLQNFDEEDEAAISIALQGSSIYLQMLVDLLDFERDNS